MANALFYLLWAYIQVKRKFAFISNETNNVLMWTAYFYRTLKTWKTS